MSVVVRTLETPTQSEDDRKLAWVDKPALVDVTHDTGQSFTVGDGSLYVWAESATATGSKPIGVYAPNCWIFARTDATP